MTQQSFVICCIFGDLWTPPAARGWDIVLALLEAAAQQHLGTHSSLSSLEELQLTYFRCNVRMSLCHMSNCTTGRVLSFCKLAFLSTLQGQDKADSPMSRRQLCASVSMCRGLAQTLPRSCTLLMDSLPKNIPRNKGSGPVDHVNRFWTGMVKVEV